MFMSSETNKSLVRKLFECFNSNDQSTLKEFDELCSSNLQLHDPAAASVKPGVQTLKQTEMGYMKAFPNKKTIIDSMFATDNDVAVCWTTTATHKGEFNGVNPTNKNVKIQGISVYHISNNKIDDITQNWDRLGLMQQLGVTQASAQARK
jgi:steroid delta-isomerase-like uncharacterized protein